MSGRRITVDLDALTEGWNNDVPLEQLAERLDCSVATLRKYARDCGLPPRKRGRRAADRDGLSGGEWVMGADGIQRWVSR